MIASVVFDRNLVQRYDVAGPRYTSYPTVLQFHDGFGEADYRAAAMRSNRLERPLSLYFHIPFCSTVCFYCACNRIITADRRQAIPYLDSLYREIELQGDLFGHRPVHQLHWGGGTPTYLNMEQMAALMHKTRRHFRLLNDDSGDYSVEIDPRSVTPGVMSGLRTLGFNRASLGVQDFDPAVQKAVNRIQSVEQTAAIMAAAREQGFRSLNVDLIYGLPLQSVASFSATLERVLELEPDRLSVFNYAHLPSLFKVQRQIDVSQLPAAAEKLDILQLAVERLTAAGYVYIGMDHFARPDDSLAIAQQRGTLHRNFQGYTTHGDCDLVGLGMTSISMINDSYSQNAKTTEAYGQALAEGRLPVIRGLRLSADDHIRRAVIMKLICDMRLGINAFSCEMGIDFADYFASEVAGLQLMAKDGLLYMDADSIEVLPPGRFLIRNICMIFDRYLASRESQRFSRAI